MKRAKEKGVSHVLMEKGGSRFCDAKMVFGMGSLMMRVG